MDRTVLVFVFFTGCKDHERTYWRLERMGIEIGYYSNNLNRFVIQFLKHFANSIARICKSQGSGIFFIDKETTGSIGNCDIASRNQFNMIQPDIVFVAIFYFYWSCDLFFPISKNRIGGIGHMGRWRWKSYAHHLHSR